MSEELHHELQGHLTPVQLPLEVRAVPGVEVHHPEHEAVEHAQKLEVVGAVPAGTAALVASVTNTPDPHIEEVKTEGLRFSIFGSDNPGAWASLKKEKLKQREELQHAV